MVPPKKVQVKNDNAKCTGAGGALTKIAFFAAAPFEVAAVLRYYQSRASSQRVQDTRGSKPMVSQCRSVTILDCDSLCVVLQRFCGLIGCLL
ncbi:hypothetical protein JTB14_030059 [Gonioctena quinquepunctata]|nr:hypothetical protein JTB14_030059 [Gonioctena quinquepunctata]